MICQENEATKTNSHVIPSFLITTFTSYDGSGKRDTEVMFSISNNKDSVYTGRSVSDAKYESLFDMDNLTKERIHEELSKNTVAKDFIFCPQCEKRLADLLESPYAQNQKTGKNIDNDVPLFFWLSVVWRMSVSSDYGFSLGEDINNKLQLYLKSYFIQKEAHVSVEDTISYVPFRYKLLRCNDYCKFNSGFCFAKFEDGILNLVIGNYILQVIFDLQSDFPNSTFFGAETSFAETTINHGTSQEVIMDLSVDEYKKIMDKFLPYAAHLKRIAIEKNLDTIWKQLGLLGMMPIELKKEFFEKYYDEKVKIGDRHESKRFANVLTSILAKYFNIDSGS